MSVAKQRLQKLIARSGVASRRGAEQLIAAGRVTVNGGIVRLPGTLAEPDRDRILVDGEALPQPCRRYLAIHKPPGVICSLKDRFAGTLIVDLLGPEITERVYPAGRLDCDSEGLVILTNDGALMHAITRPGSGVEKVYEVDVEGNPTAADLARLSVGMRLGDRRLLPCLIEPLNSLQRGGAGIRLRVVLQEGKKNQIRRMFAAIGHPVHRLVRRAIGPVRLGELASGAVRDLRPAELDDLRARVGL